MRGRSKDEVGKSTGQFTLTDEARNYRIGGFHLNGVPSAAGFLPGRKSHLFDPRLEIFPTFTHQIAFSHTLSLFLDPVCSFSCPRVRVSGVGVDRVRIELKSI